MERNKPMVSVCCLTYNHEKYIRSALEGFVSQNTTFPYVVFVHDGASTDGTAGIIKEYANKYPDIISPILQEENQYSKNIPIIRTFIYPKIESKYIAFCEGDDYWCDENKLQQQVEWIESHDDCSFCVHNSIKIDSNTGEESLFNTSKVDYDIPFEEIVEGGGARFHTSSFLFRTEHFSIPSVFYVPKVGDYPRALYMATLGKVHFFAKAMSVYRYNLEGSYTWRSSHGRNTLEKNEKKWNEIRQMLFHVDEYTQGVHHDVIMQKIRKGDFDILVEKGKLKELKTKYRELYNQLQGMKKLKVHIIFFFPHLIHLYRQLRSR